MSILIKQSGASNAELRKLLLEHEKAETPEQEAAESAEVQALERKAGTEPESHEKKANAKLKNLAMHAAGLSATAGAGYGLMHIPNRDDEEDMYLRGIRDGVKKRSMDKSASHDSKAIATGLTYGAAGVGGLAAGFPHKWRTMKKHYDQGFAEGAGTHEKKAFWVGFEKQAQVWSIPHATPHGVAATQDKLRKLVKSHRKANG